VDVSSLVAFTSALASEKTEGVIAYPFTTYTALNEAIQPKIQHYRLFVS